MFQKNYTQIIAIVLISIALLGLALFVFVLHLRKTLIKSIPPDNIKVACVGDSITYGAYVFRRNLNSYPVQLEKLLGSNKYFVGNFGENGHTLQNSGDLPYMTSESFKKSLEFSPDIVVIMLGTNDSKEQNRREMKEYKNDYLKLISEYRKLSSNPKIVLLTSPTLFPVGDSGRIMLQMSNEILDDMSEVVKQIGEELGLMVIDIHFSTENCSEYFKLDGIHPNADGAAFIAQRVYEAFEKLY